MIRSMGLSIVRSYLSYRSNYALVSSEEKRSEKEKNF
jgi:hypothetical protein